MKTQITTLNTSPAPLWQTSQVFPLTNLYTQPNQPFYNPQINPYDLGCSFQVSPNNPQYVPLSLTAIVTGGAPVTVQINGIGISSDLVVVPSEKVTLADGMLTITTVWWQSVSSITLVGPVAAGVTLTSLNIGICSTSGGILGPLFLDTQISSQGTTASLQSTGTAPLPALEICFLPGLSPLNMGEAGFNVGNLSVTYDPPEPATPALFEPPVGLSAIMVSVGDGAWPNDYNLSLSVTQQGSGF